jgi:hypothetical protein
MCIRRFPLADSDGSLVYMVWETMRWMKCNSSHLMSVCTMPITTHKIWDCGLKLFDDHFGMIGSGSFRSKNSWNWILSAGVCSSTRHFKSSSSRSFDSERAQVCGSGSPVRQSVGTLTGRQSSSSSCSFRRQMAIILLRTFQQMPSTTAVKCNCAWTLSECAPIAGLFCEKL